MGHRTRRVLLTAKTRKPATDWWRAQDQQTDQAADRRAYRRLDMLGDDPVGDPYDSGGDADIGDQEHGQTST